MLKFQMLIGGKWVDAISGKTYRAVNPATCEDAAEIPLADGADVDRAVEAARQAFPAWSRKSQAERSDLIWKMSALLKENEEEINRIEVLDHGTPIKLARIQRHISCMNLEYAAQASRGLMGSALPYGSDTLSSVQREPIGVCALIIPWNSPLMMVTSKMGACLATGNTCVIKPSAIDSMVTLKLAEIIGKLELPPGVINVITGPGGSVGRTGTGGDLGGDVVPHLPGQGRGQRPHPWRRHRHWLRPGGRVPPARRVGDVDSGGRCHRPSPAR